MSPSQIIKDWYRFLNPRFQNLFSEFPVDLKPRYGDQGHPLLLEIISQNETEYVAWIEKIVANKAEFQTWKSIEDNSNDYLPHWNNGFLPTLDMMSLYTMIGSIRPKRYVEIGSGNSTKVAARAVKQYNIDTEIISIDPHPRAEIDQLSDHIIRKGLEQIDLSSIKNLNKGDVLFIDNSHRILPNSDATVVFMDILPFLKPGVIIHLHDVYLPYDYPQFMCDRFYSEQYGLAMMMLSNPERYHTILPCFYISQDSNLNGLLDPIWSISSISGGEKHGGSYWLEVR